MLAMVVSNLTTAPSPYTLIKVKQPAIDKDQRLRACPVHFGKGRGLGSDSSSFGPRNQLAQRDRCRWIKVIDGLDTLPLLPILLPIDDHLVEEFKEHHGAKTLMHGVQGVE